MSEPKHDNSQEKPEECEGCGFETQDLKAYENFRMGNDPETHKWLCTLCAGTMSGNAAEYPEFHKDKDVLAAICYVGNVILKKIGEPS